MISTFHIVLAMKPLEGNFAQNALKHGVAGINVDGCRVAAEGTDLYYNRSLFQGRYEKSGITSYGGETEWKHGDNSMPNSAGRWPANVILEDNEKVKGLFPETGNDYRKNASTQSGSAFHNNEGVGERGYDDSGSASRFFKQVKEE